MSPGDLFFALDSRCYSVNFGLFVLPNELCDFQKRIACGFVPVDELNRTFGIFVQGRVFFSFCRSGLTKFGSHVGKVSLNAGLGARGAIDYRCSY